MRASRLFLFLLLLAMPSICQQPVPDINTETPEGKLLQQIGETSGDAEKVALMEDFVAKYASHEAAPWVYSLMAASYTKLGQHDKVMAAAEKTLAAQPTDLQTALAGLKAAEATKNPETILKWSAQVSGRARKVSSTDKTADEEEEQYKARVDFAKQLDTYADYSLYAAGLQEIDPKEKSRLFRALEERAPDSEYLTQSYPQYFLALSQTGDAQAASAVAEKAFAKNAASEEMLVFLGDNYLRQNKELDKVLNYSAQLLQLVNSKPKPEGIADADWQKRKNQLQGLGYWMAGTAQSLQGKYAEADKSLRLGLPLVEGNDEVKAGTLFHLGVANYRLKNIADAMKFNQQCIAIKSPYQPLAEKNLKAIKSEYRVVK
jgi:tetratricopeptide (TPR) repeat protein